MSERRKSTSGCSGVFFFWTYLGAKIQIENRKVEALPMGNPQVRPEEAQKINANVSGVSGRFLKTSGGLLKASGGTPRPDALSRGRWLKQP